MLVERAADIGTHALRGQRRHLLADERKRDADHGHGGERHAVVDDGTHVVRTDTFINHLGNHQWRQQVKDYFDQLARRANHHISAKLTTKTPEQLNHKKGAPYHHSHSIRIMIVPPPQKKRKQLVISNGIQFSEGYTRTPDQWRANRLIYLH